MAIEKAGEAVQTELIAESREERLGRLFVLEMDIQVKKGRKEQLKAEHNAINNEIKSMEKDKVDLLNLIERGQQTFQVVESLDVEAEEEADDLNDDMPSDDELAALDDEAETEGQTGLELGTDEAEAEEEETPFDDPARAEEETEVAQVDTPDDEQPGADPFPEEKQADHWQLVSAEDFAPIGEMRSKKEPTIGAILILPVNLRANGMEHFRVKDYGYKPGSQAWEVFAELLTREQKKEIEAQREASGEAPPF